MTETNIKRYILNRPLLNIVDKERGFNCEKPLVQIDAINQYEKSNKISSKDYPSLELVRLEKSLKEKRQNFRICIW